MTAALLFPFVLSAFPALAPADAIDPEAKQRFDRGLASYNAKEYASAIRSLRVAYALDPQPGILFAWAQAERLHGRCTWATKLYRRFLKARPSAQQAEAARAGIDRCKDQPDTTTVDPDDEVLEEKPSEVAPEPILEESEPEPEPMPMPAPVKPKRRIDAAGIGMLGAGVVLGAVGTGLLAAGQSKAKAAMRGSESYDAYADDASHVRNLRISGGVLAGVGGALIIAGVVKLVLRARQPPRNDVSFWTAPVGAGVIVRLRF